MRIEIGTTDSRAYLAVDERLTMEKLKQVCSALGVNENVFLIQKTPSGDVSETALPYEDRVEGIRQIIGVAEQIADVFRKAGVKVEVDETVHDLSNGGRLFTDGQDAK